MEKRTRIQPETAQDWRAEPHTSQPLLFASCLCMYLIICIDVRCLFFPYFSCLSQIKAFSTNLAFSKSFFRTHRNAFRSMKPRNWNALHHTAKERSHTDSTMELAPKLTRKYLCQGPAPFHDALQSLSQGSCPVSSLRAATLILTVLMISARSA